jgi:hypothetical protein
MTDFGLIGKLIDVIRSGAQTRDERQLQEKFVAIVNRLDAAGANTLRARVWFHRVLGR